MQSSNGVYSASLSKQARPGVRRSPGQSPSRLEPDLHSPSSHRLQHESLMTSTIKFALQAFPSAGEAHLVARTILDCHNSLLMARWMMFLYADVASDVSCILS